MIEMLENVISIPLFLQIPIFGLQFALILYQIDSVSDHVAFRRPRAPKPQETTMHSPHSIANLPTLLQHFTNISLALIVSVCKMFWYALYTYVVCHHITAITVNVGSIGDFAYNMPWYYMPRSEQMIVEMIIRRAQQPSEIKGLGLFVCSLETFSKVRAADA